MRYLDEFRNEKLVEAVSDKISEIADPKRRYCFMEVCGTHTMAIQRYALKSKIAPNIELVSGPGCPVCVTENDYIDKAVSLSRRKEVIIATFGDMLRVPGSASSLEKERASGRDIRVVYSTTDALELAGKNPGEKVVFLGVGFETTAPTVASSILEAKRTRLANYFVLSGHKLIPPALNALVNDKGLAIDGFILPAHVSTVIGAGPYEFLAKRFRIPCVIAGFEPLDILQGIYMLLSQISRRKVRVQIQYNRVAKTKGNPAAQKVMDKVFKKTDAHWRGLGPIKASGLKIKKEFGNFDAEKAFTIKAKKTSREPKGCICGQVLKGIKKPVDCKLFALRCRPERPVGPCMVSSEGTCAAYFRYGK